jgi:hypothetical protein
MSAVLKAAPSVARGPAAMAWRSHTALVDSIEAQLVKPQAALNGVLAQLADFERDRRELDSLRRQRRESVTALHVGDAPPGDIVKLSKAINALEQELMSARDEEAALIDAAAQLRQTAAALESRLHVEKLRGGMLLHAKHRERIIELLPEYANTLAPARAIWARILAHADAADALRVGADAGLVPTAVDVQRDIAVPQLVNLPVFAEVLVPLLAAAHAQAITAASKYIAEWKG